MTFRLVVEYIPSSGSVSNIVDIQDCISATFDNGLLDYWSESDGSGSEYLGSGYYMYDNSELSSMNWSESEGWSSDVYIHKYDSKDDIPTNPGGGTGGTGGGSGGGSENNSNPSAATIKYFFKSSGDPADYTTGYVGDDSYTEIISHYGLSLVAGSTTTRTLTYYTDSEQSDTDTYSITSPKDGYLLYSVVSSPELGQEDYNKVDYDIKVYCFKAPTITVAYTSTPDTLFGNPPATIFVQPNAFGKVGSFAADWGMIGGMVVTTSFRLNTGYKFLNWTIEKGSTTETETKNEYRYTVDTFDNVTITANFERLPAITLQVNPSTAGIVSPSAGVKTPTNDDYKIKLTASPNENYKFDKWTKNSTTISTSQEYTYTASEGENTTITANFSSTQPDTPDTPEEPSDGRIATQSDIAIKSNYVYEFMDDENKCPTKSEINSGSNNIANINNIYTDIQCVKYTDVVFNAIDINCKIKTSIIAFVNTPGVEIFRGNTKFSTLQTASSANDMNVNNDKSSTTAIDCTYLNDSSSPDAVLKVKVYNTNWGGKRVITVTCNGISKKSSQTKDFTATFDTIYFKEFLRNKYDINVFFKE